MQYWSVYKHHNVQLQAAAVTVHLTLCISVKLSYTISNCFQHESVDTRLVNKNGTCKKLDIIFMLTCRLQICSIYLETVLDYSRKEGRNTQYNFKCNYKDFILKDKICFTRRTQLHALQYELRHVQYVVVSLIRSPVSMRLKQYLRSHPITAHSCTFNQLYGTAYAQM
jgi:hypothetical protein